MKLEVELDAADSDGFDAALTLLLRATENTREELIGEMLRIGSTAIICQLSGPKGQEKVNAVMQHGIEATLVLLHMLNAAGAGSAPGGAT